MSDSGSKVPPLSVDGKPRRGRSPVGKKGAKEEGSTKKSPRSKKSPRKKGKVEGKVEGKGSKVRRAKSADGSRRGVSKSPTKEASDVNPFRRTAGTSELLVRPKVTQESPLHSYKRILLQLSRITVHGSSEALEQATAALLPERYQEENQNRILLTAREQKHLRKIVGECEKLFARQEELKAPVLLQRATRTFLAKRRLAKTRAELHPAARAFHRFIKEQLRYLDSIAIIVDHFLAPLRNTSDPGIRARVADIHAVFCNIDELEAAALILVRRLRKYSDDSWPHLRGMGEVFIELAPEFAVYDRYAENHVFAGERLRDLMATCPSFKHMVEQTSARFKVSLPDLLMLPLEHLSTFSTILRKFESREKSEEERQVLLNACAVMETRLASVNAARAKSNKTFFVSQVQRTLIPSKKPYTRSNEILTTVDVRKEGRVFKSEIIVDMKTKKGAITKKVPVKLLAFNDVCLLVRPREGEGREEKNELLDVFNLETTIVTQQAGGFSLREVDDEPAAPLSPRQERGGDKKALPKERRFACESDGNASRVVTTIQSLIDQCQHRVFGIDLEALLEREDSDSGVPAVLKLCGDYLRERVDEEGILRIPGSKAEEAVLVQMLNKSTDVDLSSTNATVHDVGTVFKHFLTDLPQPLISQEARVKMVEEQQKYELERSKSKFIRALRGILRPTRKAELNTLRYVSELMYDLAHMEKGKDNKMTCENLATCVGPDVMQPEAENMAQVLLIPIANNALGFLFEHYVAIFKDL